MYLMYVYFTPMTYNILWRSSPNKFDDLLNIANKYPDFASSVASFDLFGVFKHGLKTSFSDPLIAYGCFPIVIAILIVLLCIPCLIAAERNLPYVRYYNEGKRL